MQEPLPSQGRRESSKKPMIGRAKNSPVFEAAQFLNSNRRLTAEDQASGLFTDKMLSWYQGALRREALLVGELRNILAAEKKKPTPGASDQAQLEDGVDKLSKAKKRRLRRIKLAAARAQGEEATEKDDTGTASILHACGNGGAQVPRVPTTPKDQLNNNEAKERMRRQQPPKAPLQKHAGDSVSESDWETDDGDVPFRDGLPQTPHLKPYLTGKRCGRSPGHTTMEWETVPKKFSYVEILQARSKPVVENV